MKKINYIKQPTDYLCGQACVAIVLLPQYGHWILYYDGKYYDPEFGLMDELYQKARIQSYLEIYIDEDQKFHLKKIDTTK